jgi:fatty-acid desaturase
MTQTLTREYYPIRWEIFWFMAVVHILAAVSIPFASTTNFIALAVLYPLTAMGVTIGLHRMMSHQSFKAPKWLERLLMTCGALAAQGGPIEWVGLHRHHHMNSDQPTDHHDSRKGFWWSHMNWMFHSVPAMKHINTLTKDLQKDPYYVWLETNFLLLQLPLGILLYLLGGWSMVGWGIFVRMVLVYHVTWLVNSATHRWGYRRYATDEHSRNNWWVALLTFGEGWHNNHHAEQRRARHGLTWWEIDISWLIILTLERAGLITKVKHS